MPHAIRQIHTGFYPSRVEMHQPIPAVPIPSGISRAFAHVLILGVGHLKIYYCPRGRVFAFPWDDPGAFDTSCNRVTSPVKYY